MRMLPSLLALAMVAAVPGVAKADLFTPGDFAAVVIDPLPAASEITLIPTTSFVVTLSSCHADQLFGLSTADFVGCFTGMNVSGQTLTSLQMEFPAIYLSGNVLDLPNCPTVSQGIFTTLHCDFTDSSKTEYLLQFSGGSGIPTAPGIGGDCDHDNDGGRRLNNDDIACDANSIFTIAIGGIPFRDLPQNFTVNANTVTPEPASIWLMTTGAMSVGLFAAFRRRQMLRVPGR
jgi:hypothetical protein